MSLINPKDANISEAKRFEIKLPADHYLFSYPVRQRQAIAIEMLNKAHQNIDLIEIKESIQALSETIKSLEKRLLSAELTISKPPENADNKDNAEVVDITALTPEKQKYAENIRAAFLTNF